MIQRSRAMVETGPSPPARRGVGEERFVTRERRRRRDLALRPTGFALAAIDVVVAIASVAVSTILSPHISFAYTKPGVVGYFEVVIPFCVIVAIVSHAIGLHDGRRSVRMRRVVKQAAITALTAYVLLIAWSYLFHYQLIGRRYGISIMLFLFGGIAGSRYLIQRLVTTARVRRCVVGDERLLFELNQLLREHEAHPVFEVPLIFDTDADQDLTEFVHAHDVDEIVLDSRTDCVSDRDLLELTMDGIKFTEFPDYVSEQLGVIPVQSMRAKWLCYSLETSKPFYAAFKRIGDVTISLIGLVCAAPILALAAALIRCEGKGPIIYSQLRVGKFNRLFKIYKLRTMRTDAESSGARWAAKNDKRVTRVGKWLRRTRIDEIPQFWNVIRGDMSIVGPRPERPEFIDDLVVDIPFYVQRHLVAPGITGWAQINFPYGSSREDAERKLMYDLYYVRKASLVLDLHICVRTIAAITQGAR